MKMMMIVVSLLMVAVCLPHVQVAASDLTDSDRRLLDAVVEKTLKRGDIPGMVLSIVTDSSVLVEKGYGVRNVSSGQRMSADTLVPLGSTTKAFTTALLAFLIEKHATTTDAVKSVRAHSVTTFFIMRLSVSSPSEYCF